MRKDENIYNGIAKDLVEEKTSGCCIRNDGSGCVQSVRSKCSVSKICIGKKNFGFITICGIPVLWTSWGKMKPQI